MMSKKQIYTPQKKIHPNQHLQNQRAPALIKQLDRPLLSVAMMVKNEEDFLEDALKSAQKIADEIVVVDTGSTDRTVEIAKAYNTKLSFYEWQNDFSDARNETIRRSQGDWIFILDADERIVAKNQNPKFFQDFRNHLVPSVHFPYQALMLNVSNQTLAGAEMNSLHSIRVFPRHEHLKYQNRVHNQFAVCVPNVEKQPDMSLQIYPHIYLIHLGYDPDVYAKKKKTARSLPLIEAMVKENPNNYIYRFYLGREYLINKKYSLAIEILEETIFELLDQPEKGYFVETLKTLLYIYEIEKTILVEAEKIEVLAAAGVAYAKEQPDFWYHLALAQYQLKKNNDAIQSAKKCIETLENFEIKQASQSNPYLFVTPWKAYELASEIFWALDQYQDAYQMFLKIIKQKPETEAGWPFLLNSACAIAIDQKDSQNLALLLEKLIIHPDTPLDMFFVQLDLLIQSQRIKEAKELILWAKNKSSRLRKNEHFNSYFEKLDIQR